MLSDRMLKGLNEQITKELYSSYLYLQMAAYFDNQTLKGFGTWMKVQAQEEIAHAMIFFNYVNDQSAYVVMGPMDKPGAAYKSALDIFQKTLAHERTVTASINNLMDIALKDKDYATRNRLEWFISEQVEEEARPAEIIGKLKLVGDKGDGIFMLDKELGMRTFVLPAPLAAGGAPAAG